MAVSPQLNVNVTDNESDKNKEDFIKLQSEGEDLKKAWSYVENKKNSFKISNGVLIISECLCGEIVDPVVLTTFKSKEVLRMAHETPLAGHLGEQKKRQRKKYSFFCRSIKNDIKKFC